MTMTPAVRKGALTVHLTVSVGWVGAIIAYLALGLTASTTQDPETIRAAWIAMEAIGWYAIVPLALTSLATGLLMGLGTRWGLFRHYWVVFSLVLTIFAAIILLLHMPTVSAIAELAREADAATLRGLGGDRLHAVGGLAVLLLVTGLNVVKPRGLTPYGRRKQEQGLDGTS